MVKEAIVLAGGLGTRLRRVVNDVPKPMAKINGVPFLEYLLGYLNTQGIDKVILSVGYKYEVIRNYFGKEFSKIRLFYSIEDELLGTGGGIKKSLEFVESELVFVLNGDTYFNISLLELVRFHKSRNSLLTVALKRLKFCNRYGLVVINDKGRIIGFREKGYYNEGLINAGIYLLNKPFFESLDLGEKFSFEKDFLERYYLQYPFYGLILNGYFIDIGTPEDYEKFKKDVLVRKL